MWLEPVNPKFAATWIMGRSSKSSNDPEDRELLLSFAPTSFIAVPLKTYDRVLGAIVMVNTSEGRMCGTEELALAEELAHRAALAIDNASLYKTGAASAGGIGAGQPGQGFLSRHAQSRAAHAADAGADVGPGVGTRRTVCLRKCAPRFR